MALAAGTHLGPYEILSPLGAGGMGEVYKARDTRLDRTIAIKILPELLAADPEFRARFTREARTLSQLTHPHICTLHDIGEHEGTAFLVMELLSGETLAVRLERGALALGEALTMAIQIAEALDAAHRAGIVHRDLKPGNIMRTKEGAKLLDFGLAKLATIPSGGVFTAAATAASPLTGQGAILGTLLYMSPEQVEGREVDSRSDIFSFGAVLYEMITGARAFDGGSQASIMAAILDRDPPTLSTRAPLAPAALDRLVRKCLAKDPDRRWQTARDLADELAWIAQRDAERPGKLAVPAATGGRRVVAAAAAGLILGIAAALLWPVVRSGADVTAPTAQHLAIPMPDGVRLVPGGIAASPDGATVAFVAARLKTDESNPRAIPATESGIYIRRFDGEAATLLAGTAGARAPFFSPDGLWIAYFTASALMKVSLLGGSPVRLAATPPVTRGGTWAPDDTIIFAPSQSTALLRLPASGGTELITPSAGATNEAQLWPELLPGGEDVLFTIRRGTTNNLDDADIAVQNIRSGEQRVLMRGGGYARYARGHLLYVRSGTLMAVAFDPSKKQVTGTPVPIAERVAVDPYVGGAHFAVTRDGTLLHLRGSFGETRATIAWVDRSGKPIRGAVIAANELDNPRLSPAGTRVVLSATAPEGDDEIYISDVARGGLVRFSSDPGDDFNPIWTPDGTRIIYTSLKIGALPQLVWRRSDGSGAAEPLVPRSEPQFAGSVSTQGWLAYTAFPVDSADIWVMPLSGERQPRPFAAGTHNEFGPEFSPDGRWLAYISNEAGRNEVYVAPFPGPGVKRRISNEGGVAPAWSANGQELFYQSAAGMMAVSVSSSETEFSPSEPRLLFTGDFVIDSTEDGPRNYDVAGDRFLMIRRESLQSAPLSFNVVFNWVAEMTRRAKP